MNLSASELKVVYPVNNGLDLLEYHLELGELPLCVCKTGLDYHVGINDSENLMDKHSYKREYDMVFVPPSSPIPKADVEQKAEKLIKDVERVYKELKGIYPNYKKSKRLGEQNASIKDAFTNAFNALRRVNILPNTTGNTLFNHQSMFLLMESAFKDKSRFQEYMADSSVLDKNQFIEEKREIEEEEIKRIKRNDFGQFLLEDTKSSKCSMLLMDRLYRNKDLKIEIKSLLKDEECIEHPTYLMEAIKSCLFYNSIKNIDDYFILTNRGKKYMDLFYDDN